MKTRTIAMATGALLVALLVAAACGGDGGGGGDEAGIRIEKGLSVAALVSSAGRGGEVTEGQSGGALIAPGDPSADTGVSTGAGSGVVAPDFAPYPFPSLQESQTGITVQGFGSASVDADSAVLEFYFGTGFDGIEPLPLPGRGETEPGFEGSSSSPTEVQPLELSQQITEADLQRVVDAIAAQGVSRADIEVIVEPFYGDPYYGGSATIRVTASNIDAVEGIVSAATEAASGLENVALQGSNVTYTASDCAALELAAMQAAVEDALERGQTFATALGVGLGSVVGASHYSYSPFGSPCDSGFGGPYPLGGIAYAEGQAMEVQLIANVTVTFAIQ